MNCQIKLSLSRGDEALEFCSRYVIGKEFDEVSALMRFRNRSPSHWHVWKKPSYCFVSTKYKQILTREKQSEKVLLNAEKSKYLCFAES